MAWCDTDWGELELELRPTRYENNNNNERTTTTKVTDMKVVVVATAAKPAYWETELSKVAPDTKPSTTLVYDGTCMKVLARSRDGQYIACAAYNDATALVHTTTTSTMKKMLVLQKRTKPAAGPNDDWVIMREVILDKDFEDSAIIITDAEQQITVRAKVQEEEEEDPLEDTDLSQCFSPHTNKKKKKTKSAQLIDVCIPPATLMMMPSKGSVSCMTIHDEQHCATIPQQQQHVLNKQQAQDDYDEDEDESTDVVLGGAEAKAVACFIKQRAQERRQELSDAFRRFHKTDAEQPSDFTLSYHAHSPSSSSSSLPAGGNTSSFPSLLSSSRKIGRPTYSADKGPRQCKSPPLTLQEEMQGIFSLFAILRNMRNFPEQWSVSQQTQALYARTIIYKELIAKRTEVAAVIWQLRRWLPRCKLLAKDKPSTPTHDTAQQQSLTPANERWMQKRGVVLRAHIDKWIQEGEPSVLIVGHSPHATMRTWVDASLDALVHTATGEGSSSGGKPTTTTTEALSSSSSHSEASALATSCVCYSDALRQQDLLFMDEARKKLLAGVLAPTTNTNNTELMEAKAKKIQKSFQQLAQDLMGHERNHKALHSLLDKVDDVLTRINCVEKHAAATLQELQQQTTDGDQTIAHVQWLMDTRMKHIERHYAGEIHDTLADSREILQHKRKLRENDQFLSEISDFLSQLGGTDAL